MNARKFGTVAVVTALSSIVLGGFINTNSTTAHAAANFTAGAKETRNPMGAALGSTMAKKYNISMPEANKGYFSGGSTYIGPRVGTSAAGATTTIQVKVSKTSKGTTFELEPAKAGEQPEKATLRLDGVPNIAFSGTKKEDIKKGNVTLMADSYKVEKGTSAEKMAFDGNQDGLIEINDKTMSDKSMGWSLFAAITPLTDKAGDTLDATLNLKLMGDNGVADTSTSLSSMNGEAKSVLMAAKGTGLDTTKVMVDQKGTTLTINKNENIQAGVYQANVVWTLANNANAQANMANANANRGASNNQ